MCDFCAVSFGNWRIKKIIDERGKKPQKAAEVMNKAQRLLVILIQNILKRDLIVDSWVLLQP